MNAFKIVAALFLSASLLSAPAFAQQTTTPASQTTVQASADQGLDLYLDGTLVASGALAYSNTIVTLGAAGYSTLTAYPHGAAASTATPVYTFNYFSTVPNQVVHVNIGGTYSVFVY